MFVALAILCVKLHTVFLARKILSHLAKFHFLHLLYHSKKKGKEEGEFITVRMLLESEENFHFPAAQSSKCGWCLLCFQHLKYLFPSGSYLCFPMNSHRNTTLHGMETRKWIPKWIINTFTHSIDGVLSRAAYFVKFISYPLTVSCTLRFHTCRELNKIIAYMDGCNAKSLLTIIIQLEGISEVYLCVSL